MDVIERPHHTHLLRCRAKHSNSGIDWLWVHIPTFNQTGISSIAVLTSWQLWFENEQNRLSENDRAAIRCAQRVDALHTPTPTGAGVVDIFLRDKARFQQRYNIWSNHSNQLDRNTNRHSRHLQEWHITDGFHAILLARCVWEEHSKLHLFVYHGQVCIR